MAGKHIYVLSAEQDWENLQPILNHLEQAGIRLSQVGDKAKKQDLLLVSLSEHFYDDEKLQEVLLSHLASGAENVLPLQLDDTPIPDRLKNALYARNIIPAANRDAAQIAERIKAAIPSSRPVLFKILIAAAIVLLAAAGLFLWRSHSAEPPVPVVESDPIVIPTSLGLTQADLETIEDIVIVGDYFGYFTDADFREAGEHWLNVNDDVAYRTFENDTPMWISKDDGREFSMTRYDDLRFLELMPKLRFLELVEVEIDADRLPDLSGASLLEGVSLSNCAIDSLDWLTDANMRSFEIHNTRVTDYTPLTSCARLQNVQIDLYMMQETELSGFAPQALTWLRLENAHEVSTLDLSGLAGCDKLEDVQLGALPLRDLAFLENKSLINLELWDLPEIRDISAVETLKALQSLSIEGCPRITDYAPISGCAALEELHLQCDENPDAVRDASFLRELPKLRDIGLYSCNLRDLDFLEGIALRQKNINLGFAGEIGDYSGLAFIKSYDSLHINPRRAGGNFGDLSAVLPYLEGATVKNLHLHDCGGIDLSLLPEVTERLEIWYGDLRDLSTMPAWAIQRLQLYDCQYLTGLDGIEQLSAYSQSGVLNLDIFGCPRLTDWSAVEAVSLSGLSLSGVYSLPTFDTLDFGSLHLESIEGLNDLHILDGLSDGHSYNSIELVGLDGIAELSPLRRLRIDFLEIPPQLADQAEELLADGVIKDYEVAYPDSSWQPFEGEVELLSLEELDTLPKSLLKRVERLAIAGDMLYDEGQYDIWEQWEDGSDLPTPCLHDRETDELTPIETGAFTSFDRLASLTGLKELRLYAEPLTSLDGIQNLSGLEFLEIEYCPNLTDASAAFALPELWYLCLRQTGIDSIQGVQNLTELRNLNIASTNVTDLSPLAACDLSAAYGMNGLWLGVGGTDIEDFTPLSGLERFEGIDMNSVPSDRWVDAIADVSIGQLYAGGCFGSSDDLAAVLLEHPELEELHIPWNEKVTDLTPLLAMENLRYVKVSANMEKAIDSLGHNYGFELEIEG